MQNSSPPHPPAKTGAGATAVGHMQELLQSKATSFPRLIRKSHEETGVPLAKSGGNTGQVSRTGRKRKGPAGWSKSGHEHIPTNAVSIRPREGAALGYCAARMVRSRSKRGRKRERKDVTE